MAKNFSPTAANIISSLGVKGATSSDNLPGFVPVLGDDGKLSAKFIPADAAQLAIPAISNVAYVDPYTDVADGVRKGSIVAPFKSLSEAAQNFVPTEYAKAAKNIAFILAPGTYTDTSVKFSETLSPLRAYFIGIGECRFAGSVIAISGMSSASGSTPEIVLQNIVTSQMTIVGSPATTCLGKTAINTLTFASSEAILKLSAESRVYSTNSANVSYLTEAANVGYGDGTVKEALDGLTARKIRIANVTVDSSGFDYDEDAYTDVSADDGVYDLRSRDKVFVEGINKLVILGKNPVFETVTADKVTADEVAAETVTTSAVVFGSYKLVVDAYGYLVVANKDDSIDPIDPVRKVVLLKDSATGIIYTIGVSNGRMYVTDKDDASSDSSSYDEVPLSLIIVDVKTGVEYSVWVENGRIRIAEA